MNVAAKTKLLFDLDGTLIDSAPWHERAYLDVLGRDGDSFRYERYLGMPTRDVFSALGYDASRAAALAREKQRNYRRYLAEGKVGLFAGAVELLRLVRDRGLDSYLVTGASRESARLALERHGIAGFFSELVTADDVAEGKPSPAPFLRLLSASRLTREESLAIEDSPAGAASAAAAGIDVVLVNQGRNDPAQGRFSSLLEFREWMEAALPGKR